MAELTVILTLPTAAYDELQERARQHHRPVEEEAALTLLAAIGASETLPSEMAAALQALARLDNEALQRVSLSQPTVEDEILLDALVDKRRRQPLRPDEEVLLAELIERHDRVMALRAEAVALLAQRGVNLQERVARA
jgi:plasmid stability protein